MIKKIIIHYFAWIILFRFQGFFLNKELKCKNLYNTLEKGE